MKNLLHSLAALAAVALLWSCSGVRDCAAPRLDMPRALAGNSTDSLTVADMEWWKFYSDSLL
ncbi:MAG: TolC family protein, partial [Muribaculaceae bacterium]|nr:TolC family protein [Muribaculaceae bacterium]